MASVAYDIDISVQSVLKRKSLTNDVLVSGIKDGYNLDISN